VLSALEFALLRSPPHLTLPVCVHADCTMEYKTPPPRLESSCPMNIPAPYPASPPSPPVPPSPPPLLFTTITITGSAPRTGDPPARSIDGDLNTMSWMTNHDGSACSEPGRTNSILAFGFGGSSHSLSGVRMWVRKHSADTNRLQFLTSDGSVISGVSSTDYIVENPTPASDGWHVMALNQDRPDGDTTAMLFTFSWPPITTDALNIRIYMDGYACTHIGIYEVEPV